MNPLSLPLMEFQLAFVGLIVFTVLAALGLSRYLLKVATRPSELPDPEVLKDLKPEANAYLAGGPEHASQVAGSREPLADIGKQLVEMGMLAPARRLLIPRLLPALLVLAPLFLAVPKINRDITLEPGPTFLFFLCLWLPIGALFFVFKGVHRKGKKRWGLVGSAPLITRRGQKVLEQLRHQHNPAVFGIGDYAGWGVEQSAGARLVDTMGWTPKEGEGGGGCGGCGG